MHFTAFHRIHQKHINRQPVRFDCVLVFVGKAPCWRIVFLFFFLRSLLRTFFLSYSGPAQWAFGLYIHILPICYLFFFCRLSCGPLPSSSSSPPCSGALRVRPQVRERRSVLVQVCAVRSACLPVCLSAFLPPSGVVVGGPRIDYNRFRA